MSMQKKLYDKNMITLMLHWWVLVHSARNIPQMLKIYFIYNALSLGSVFTLTKQPTNYWFLRNKFVF